MSSPPIEGTGSAPDRFASARLLITELESCAERWLDPYVARLQRGELQLRPKVINDPLWGSIRLHAWEVALLDTKLLQRLRFLRQLGIAHWIYPTAGHTRFEHSIGVLHQMDALLAAIDLRSGKAGAKLVDDSLRKLLRIAALLHDCGHAVMSHVSEGFVDALPGVDQLRRLLHEKYRPRKKPSASEAIAATFVCSPAFRKLLGLPQVGADFIRNVDVATEQIAGFILGGPVIPERAFLTLLVNGSFDADKLDYMPRDCLMAGVPCPVDVRRVIETVRVVEVPVDRIAPEYPKWAGLADAKSLHVLTLANSGARVLDELAMARSLLYEKVYFHHKARALEVMVRRALGHLKERSVTEWLELVDDELLVGESRVEFASIRDRDLLKRAVVLTPPIDGDTDAEARWRALMAPDEPESFREALVPEARRVAEILDEGMAALDRQPPEVDVPKVGKIELDLYAFVGDSVDEFARAHAALSGQRAEAGKRAARQAVYVFAPEGAVLAVFIAARKLIGDRYGIQLDQSAYRATRLDPEAIASAEEKLEKRGYFGELTRPPGIPEARIVSHRHHALETFIRTSWSRLEELAVRFGRYQSHGSSPISPATIADYLRQFEVDGRARAALRVLESVDFKDRQFFSRALEDRLRRPEASAVRVVCPLGATGDSSAHLAYLMNDVAAEYRRPVVQLEMALDPEDPMAADGSLLLWDDFCGKSGHSATAICQWLGLPDPPLREDLVRRLSAGRTQNFLARDVFVTFALARPSGLAELRRHFVAHGLTRLSVLDPPADDLVAETNTVFDTDHVIADTKSRNDLRQFLETRMRVALAPKCERADDPWSEATLSARLLGYGNESHLIVFPYNVPTVTLTALWCEGPGWAPLFPRREKAAARSAS